MAQDSITTRWLGNMAFEGEVDNHKIITDARMNTGGEDRGPGPKKLMLLSLAGCTGMDVVSILRKMRIEIENLTVTVNGDLTEEHPKHYTRIHVIYEITGKDLSPEKLRTAVELSEDRFCGVSAVLKKAVELTSEIRIIEPAQDQAASRI